MYFIEALGTLLIIIMFISIVANTGWWQTVEAKWKNKNK